MFKESSCTDNFTLLQGVKGERGEKGNTGSQGIQGQQGPAGPTGPSGAYKIDISLREGNNPYVILNTEDPVKKPLGYFIYPGSNSYHFQTISVAVGVTAAFNSLTAYIYIYNIESDGSQSLVATLSEFVETTMGDTTALEFYFVLHTNNLSNLPADQSTFAVYGSASGYEPDEGLIAKAYALEMR